MRMTGIDSISSKRETYIFHNEGAVQDESIVSLAKLFIALENFHYN